MRSAGMPMPVSWTAIVDAIDLVGAKLGRDAQLDIAGRGELDRIAQQVDQDLAQPCDIAHQHLRHVFATL